MAASTGVRKQLTAVSETTASTLALFSALVRLPALDCQRVVTQVISTHD